MKVRGSNDDPRKCLIKGKEYTVSKVEMHTWHTKIELEECPGKKFNSVSFELESEVWQVN